MANYEEQIYEPVLGSNVNYDFDMSQPGAEEELKKLQALLRGETSPQANPNQPPMGMEEALDLRRIQMEAQGWSAPVIYPDVMPSSNQQPPIGLTKPQPMADYRGASQVGGYAGPTRESDRPFDHGIELKATPEGVDVGDAEKQAQLLGMKLPKAVGPIQTVGQLTSLVRNMKGADKELIEGVVAALTGIDPEQRRLEREKALAGHKQGLPMSSYESARIDIDQRRLKAEEESKKYVLLNYLTNLSKSMAEQLKDPMMPADKKLLMQSDYNKLNAIIAQSGIDLLKKDAPVQGGNKPPPANPAAITQPPQAGQPHTVKLENGVTVTRRDTPGEVKAGEVTTPSVKSPKAGSFESTPKASELKGKALAEKRVMERASRIAQREGWNPRAPSARHIEQARRELRYEP